MFRISLMIGGIVSLMIGGLIFLVGIGAIAGVTAGMISLLIGGIISVVGGIAVADYFLGNPRKQPSARFNDIVDLVKRNGQWGFDG